MKVDVRKKKKPAAPSVKTVGIKKKATAPSGAAKMGKKTATTKEVKKAITKEVESKNVKIAKKKRNKGASGKTKETEVDVTSEGKAELKRKQGENEIGSVDAVEEEVKNKMNTSEQKKQVDSGKPGKKGGNTGFKPMKLKGKLYDIFWNRSVEVKARTLIVAMKNFPVGQSSDPLFESAHRMQTNKQKKLIFLEYKTKAEAKTMQNVLQKNSQIKYAKFMNRVSNEQKKPDVIMVHPKKLYIGNVPSEATVAELKMKFPTALSVIITHSKGKAKLIFKRKEDAKNVFLASSNVFSNGVKLTVLYLTPQSKPGGMKMKSWK